MNLTKHSTNLCTKLLKGAQNIESTSALDGTLASKSGWARYIVKKIFAVLHSSSHISYIVLYLCFIHHQTGEYILVNLALQNRECRSYRFAPVQNIHLSPGFSAISSCYVTLSRTKYVKPFMNEWLQSGSWFVATTPHWGRLYKPFIGWIIKNRSIFKDLQCHIYIIC